MSKDYPYRSEPDKKKLELYTITDESSELSKIGALVRFYLHEDPDKLTEDELLKAWGQLTFALKQTGQMTK